MDSDLKPHYWLHPKLSMERLKRQERLNHEMVEQLKAKKRLEQQEQQEQLVGQEHKKKQLKIELESLEMVQLELGQEQCNAKGYAARLSCCITLYELYV
ncbi:hypothetical protein AALO_G00308550, partial [Alosa alosa]